MILVGMGKENRVQAASDILRQQRIDRRNLRDLSPDAAVQQKGKIFSLHIKTVPAVFPASAD